VEPRGTALVTGASRGLGRGVAVALARRGFDVVAGVRDPDTCAPFDHEGTPTGGSIEVRRLDVTDPGDFEIPAGLRVLVNNAGFRGAYLPVENTPEDQWRTTFDTNLFGLIELCRRAIPVLRAGGGGVICNIGSCAVYMPLPFYAAYRASKAALAAVTETLQVELQPFNIRVIDVPIGGVDTDMLRSGIAHHPPDAIEIDDYAPLATNLHRLTSDARDAALGPDVVGESVVDQILLDEGPFTRICDPNAAAMVSAMGTLSIEDRLQIVHDQLGSSSATA
jgi:NAD(P)-dependent dehydrogenase (short-subunit alcohol dehydrogenase family)